MRQTVHAVDDRCDDMDDPVPLGQPVRTEIVMIVQGQRLDLRRAQRAGLVLADRPRAGQHADVGRALPELHQPFPLERVEPERIDEQGQRGLAEQLAGQRPRGGVLELPGQDVDVALRPRVFPQVVREHFGHRELVHLPEPAALGVLFPPAPVPAGTQEQLAQVCRGRLHAVRRGRV